MLKKREEIVPVRSFAGIFKFGKEKSRISIGKEAFIIIILGFSIIILLLHIIFRYFI